VTIGVRGDLGLSLAVSSGTTPKMLDKETDARFIGYWRHACGIARGFAGSDCGCSMHPGDYFAINTTPQVFSHLGLSTVNLDMFSREVGENWRGAQGVRFRWRSAWPGFSVACRAWIG